MNYPLEQAEQKGTLQWVPRILPKRRISASGERVGTGQGDSLGQITKHP